MYAIEAMTTKGLANSLYVRTIPTYHNSVMFTYLPYGEILSRLILTPRSQYHAVCNKLSGCQVNLVKDCGLAQSTHEQRLRSALMSTATVMLSKLLTAWATKEDRYHE